MKRKLLCRAPRVWSVDGFASDEEIDHVLAVGARVTEPNVSVAGRSAELAVAGDPVLSAIAARACEVTGLRNLAPTTLRFRHYRPGEHHPPHTDLYRVGAARLTLTAMLTLVEPIAGGQTYFPEASPAPLSVSPKRGRLLLWFSVTPDGAEDPRSLHQGLPVLAGEKITITQFIYRPASSRAVLGKR